MTSICYIVLYYGKLPTLMPVWVESCRNNPTINWLLYTDDRTNYNYPDNITVKYGTFEDMVKKIQNKFEFEIKIPTAYRLCDFKVAYGYIFEDEISQYDYWGYCDLDMVFGRIRGFLSEEILDAYERIGFLGHSTIYKNTYEINRAFMILVNGEELYKNIFSCGDTQNHFFDEKWMDIICDSIGLKTFRKTIYADIIPWAWKFRIGHANAKEKEKNEHRIFLWDDGKLYSYAIDKKRNLVVDEFMYIHLLKRNMKIPSIRKLERYLIVPNKLMPYSQSVNRALVYWYSFNNMLIYWLDVVERKWRRLSINTVKNYFKVRQAAKKNYYKS